MGTLLLVLQIATALTFIVLMAVQTDKAEAGGVMGLGGQGGSVGEEVDMAVGAERIFKPLSKWTAIAFLFLSALAAMNGEIVANSKGAQSLPFWVFSHWRVALLVHYADGRPRVESRDRHFRQLNN